MFIPEPLNGKYLLHTLLLAWFMSLCPIAHAQCAIHVENKGNPSSVRVILSKAAGTTVELADDRQKAKAFEEIAHILSAAGCQERGVSVLRMRDEGWHQCKDV